LQDTRTSTPHLDGLRIIAACAVVVLHYADYISDFAVGSFLVAHTWHFNVFVDLFFVVSGFVIASQYLGQVGTPLAIGRFIWRRLARIYPLHLATLAFYVVIALAIDFDLAKGENAARYPFSDLPAQLLLLHAFDGARLTFNFPSWSLSAETFCYVLFPLVTLIVVRRRSAILALVIFTALANSLYAEAAGTAPWADWINHGGAFRALPGFTLGMACYLYRDRIARWPVIPGLLPAALAAFILIGSYLTEMSALVIVYAIAVMAIQHDCAGRPSLMTALRFDRWSHLTYSCYMLHIPVATVVLTLGSHYLAEALPDGKLVLVPLALVILATASVLSFRYFETPIRRSLNDAFDRQMSGPVLASVHSGPSDTK
jgi:peptidoglycan/LPS O-acetylase OafA/YrhL